MNSLRAWVAAGLVGLRSVSAAEFDAIFGRLAQSGRTFGIGIVSRNYIAVLRQLHERLRMLPH